MAIDDEPLALSVVEHFCSKTPSIELVATFNDSVQGLQFLKENNIDILFLDINIPHLNGIELARLLPTSVKVIFTTAYQNFAIDGFELRAVDYLLKPFSFDRFSRAVSHAIHLISLEKENVKDDFLTVKADYASRNILISSIMYVEGLKDYVKLHTEDKAIVVKSTMKSITSSLECYGFVRVHRSYTINIKKVSSYNNSVIIIDNGDKIPLGDQFKSDFFKKI
ncbi:MAG: LytTR family DNA-binding domain-containing protein [Rikenellaceae bacterium]